MYIVSCESNVNSIRFNQKEFKDKIVVATYCTNVDFWAIEASLAATSDF